MRLIRREATQILIVVFVPYMELFIDKTGIFLLKYLLKHTFYRLIVIILLTILCHFVNEEKRQALYTFLEQLTLLLEVSLYRLAYLNALKMQQV